MFMILITIVITVNGAYKSTNIAGGWPHCIYSNPKNDRTVKLSMNFITIFGVDVTKIYLFGWCYPRVVAHEYDLFRHFVLLKIISMIMIMYGSIVLDLEFYGLSYSYMFFFNWLRMRHGDIPIYLDGQWSNQLAGKWSITHEACPDNKGITYMLLTSQLIDSMAHLRIKGHDILNMIPTNQLANDGSIQVVSTKYTNDVHSLYNHMGIYILYSMVYCHSYIPYLVGGLEHFLFFYNIGNFIIPTDELHHFSEG